MTQKELIKILRIALREELKQLKVELLQELNRTTQVNDNTRQSKLVEQQKKFRNEFAISPKPKVKLSSDPFLNQILQSTQPLVESTEVDYNFDMNLPTNESGNVMNVDVHNPNVAKVINAMNRDYSGFMTEKTEIRSKLKSMVLDEPAFSNDDIEEDLSWLDKVG